MGCKGRTEKGMFENDKGNEQQYENIDLLYTTGR